MSRATGEIAFHQRHLESVGKAVMGPCKVVNSYDSCNW